jgi:cytochrome bd-type quinol oxidase subunit 1
LLPAIEELGAAAQLLGRRPACVLRLSEARRRASALKASSYLRRLSGIFLLFSTLLTQELYVLLLYTLSRPPHLRVLRKRLLPRNRTGYPNGIG